MEYSKELYEEIQDELAAQLAASKEYNWPVENFTLPIEETQALLAEIDRLNKLTQWIPVSTPPKGEGVYQALRRGTQYERVYFSFEYGFQFSDVTHWLPILPLPEVS